MVSDLSHKRVLLVALPHWIVMLDEVIYEICRVHNFLLAALALQRGEISATFHISASAELIKIHLLVGYDS